MAKQTNKGTRPQEKESLPEKTKPTETSSPFDVDKVRDLVHLMKDHELSEIELADGRRVIKLKRQTGAVLAPAPVAQMVAPASAPAPALSTPAAPAKEPAPSKKLLEIKSPTPGTFYAQDKPGSKPFVEVGTKVQATSVVCIIEAMKIFNEIQAEVTGTVVEILVNDKQPVEYGQVLFRVDPGK